MISGVGGAPKGKVATVMSQALEAALFQHQRLTSLCEIHIVDMNQELVEQIKTELSVMAAAHNNRAGTYEALSIPRRNTVPASSNSMQNPPMASSRQNSGQAEPPGVGVIAGEINPVTQLALKVMDTARRIFTCPEHEEEMGRIPASVKRRKKKSCQGN